MLFNQILPKLQLVTAGRNFYVNILKPYGLSQQHCISCKWISTGRGWRSPIYEPDIIEYKPEIPEYEDLTLRFRGYDFAVLEVYTKYVHSLLRHFEYDANGAAVPARKSKTVLYRPGGIKVKDTHNLDMYERQLQIENIPSTAGPILFDVIRQNLPEGVQFTAKHLDEEEQEYVYVPDVLLKELEHQVEEIDKEREEKKK